MLTGGEPMLRPQLIVKAATEIRKQTQAPIYLYTAKVDNLLNVLHVLKHIDGLTLTLHDQRDVWKFIPLNHVLLNTSLPSTKGKSYRLNIFKGVDTPEDIDLNNWEVKDDIERIKDCPLPEDEVFRRYRSY